MADQLAVYLHDHLSGAQFALEMIERMKEVHAGEPVGLLAAELLVEIESDRSQLRAIAERVGGSSGSGVKEATAWIAEKASRLKLRLGDDTELGVFEALEALSLGILGKLKLWQMLSVLAAGDERLQGDDYEKLIELAQDQHDRVEAMRIEVGRRAFG